MTDAEREIYNAAGQAYVDKFGSYPFLDGAPPPTLEQMQRAIDTNTPLCWADEMGPSIVKDNMPGHR